MFKFLKKIINKLKKSANKIKKDIGANKQKKFDEKNIITKEIPTTKIEFEKLFKKAKNEFKKFHIKYEDNNIIFTKKAGTFESTEGLIDLLDDKEQFKEEFTKSLKGDTFEPTKELVKLLNKNPKLFKNITNIKNISTKALNNITTIEIPTSLTLSHLPDLSVFQNRKYLDIPNNLHIKEISDLQLKTINCENSKNLKIINTPNLEELKINTNKFVKKTTDKFDNITNKINSGIENPTNTTFLNILNSDTDNQEFEDEYTNTKTLKTFVVSEKLGKKINTDLQSKINKKEQFIKTEVQKDGSMSLKIKNRWFIKCRNYIIRKVISYQRKQSAKNIEQERKDNEIYANKMKGERIQIQARKKRLKKIKESLTNVFEKIIYKIFSKETIKEQMRYIEKKNKKGNENKYQKKVNMNKSKNEVTIRGF